MKELAFVPKPLPDEILYSILARAQTLALYNSPGQLSLEFFGRKNVPATVELPSYLKFFHNRVKNLLSLTEADVIGLTMWDYYYWFLAHKKREIALKLILDGNGFSLYNKVGINPSAMAKNHGLKYCPSCMKEDRKKYGTIYWHRAHQIPEILGCSHHKLQLHLYKPKSTEIKRSFYIDSNEVSDQLVGPEKELDNIAFQLSKLMSEILYQKSEFDINKVDYQGQLKETIFMKGSNLAVEKLINSFESFYGRTFINELIPNVPLTWVAAIVRRPLHYFHPLRHILLSYFLSAADIQQKHLHELEQGPWPCINKAADHFGQRVVLNMSNHVDQKSKRLIYKLTCSCGLIYTKSHDALYGTLDKTNIRILEWGHVWHAKLKRELISNKSLRAIARVLGTDAKTISKYSSLLDVEKPSQRIGQSTINSNRTAWKKLLSRFKENKVSEARKQNPALYIWLYRHDPKWFLIINSRNATKTKILELRLDWDELDKEIVDLIVSTVEKLKSEKYRGKITKSLISKIIHAQHYLLGKNAAKLPLSSVKLKSCAESIDQFHSRRIREAIDELKSGHQLKAWMVMQKAGIGKRVSKVAFKILTDELQYGT